MSFHILIVADGRSPTAQSWIRHVQSLNYDVSLLSTFPCEPPRGLKHFQVLPIAFSRYSGGSASRKGSDAGQGSKTWVKGLAPLLQFLRYRLGPLSLPHHANVYRTWVQEIKPDLVHALRIPFEGMLASYTPAEIPCLVATWGNDLTLHARGSFLMRRFTRRCLSRADGLSSDTHRDVRLAQAWGLNRSAPTLVVPGSGGLDADKIQQVDIFPSDSFGIQKTGIWVVNPRGYRPGSVHQDVFFKAIPKVLAQHPNVRFICPNLAGNNQAERWVRASGAQASIDLLPPLSQHVLWSLFAESEVFVSPSSHDGTPNALLEALTCGCFPVVGDIESLQEWIVDGENGFLANPKDPDALARAIVKALEQPDLRQSAALQNRAMIATRASSHATLPLIDRFYKGFLAGSSAQIRHDDLRAKIG